MEYKDYYAVLGVPRQANADEIKRAYRRLARKYHPDVSKEKNAEERFKEVQEAYEVLKDTDKRSTYDQLGNQWQSGQEFRPPPNWQGFEGFHFNEANGEQFSGFSDFFENIFGRGRANSGKRQRERTFSKHGRDEHAKVVISLEEAFRGGSQTIQFQVPEVDANGQAHYQTRTLKITVPPGVVPGQQLRLAKQGGPGIGNAPNGDLYLEIEISPHRFFSLQGRDIYLTFPISPWEAALGAKVTVPTLAGPVEVKIASGSQAGQKLRLKGRGLPHQPVPGDQFVLLQILTPPIKNESQRILYEKMAKEIPFNPRENLF